ncbi:MAG: alpha/beta hydrolase [Leptolyngbyaceae cyanobacterium bins.59]|nr:alpha/beta hydrolase [Leptolyngbyaceae cyanobacterium bins.59]
MAFIQIRGVDHYYEWITSAGAEPTGKPVMVFLHGWAGSGRYWESTAQALTATFDCLLYDLRGFGRSRLPRNPDSALEFTYELEGYAEELAELLDAFHLHRVYLNAHSTGSSIAVFFLNLFPQKVERAILTCSGIFDYDERAFSTFHQFGKYVVQFRPSWFLRVPLLDKLFMARFLYRPLPTAISRAFLEDFLMADYEAALGTIYTAVSKQAAEVMPLEFTQIQVPTLIVSGEYDQIIPAEMGRRAAALSPKVEFIMMRGTGHFPMLEDPETYFKHLQDFLQLPVAS